VIRFAGEVWILRLAPHLRTRACPPGLLLPSAGVSAVTGRLPDLSPGAAPANSMAVTFVRAIFPYRLAG
jgi:hypothetical protein